MRRGNVFRCSTILFGVNRKRIAQVQRGSRLALRAERMPLPWRVYGYEEQASLVTLSNPHPLLSNGSRGGDLEPALCSRYRSQSLRSLKVFAARCRCSKIPHLNDARVPPHPDFGPHLQLRHELPEDVRVRSPVEQDEPLIIENPGPASLANETVPVDQKRECRPRPPTRQLMRTRSFHSEQHISVMRRSKSSAIEPTSD